LIDVITELFLKNVKLYILKENEIVLATMIFLTITFEYLQLILQSHENESSTEYYKNIVTATTYVNY